MGHLTILLAPAGPYHILYCAHLYDGSSKRGKLYSTMASSHLLNDMLHEYGNVVSHELICLLEGPFQTFSVLILDYMIFLFSLHSTLIPQETNLDVSVTRTWSLETSL